MSAAADPPPASRAGDTPASRSSSSVLANALGNPGIVATGKIGELTRGGRVEHHACGERFGASLGPLRPRGAGKSRRGRTGRKLGQTETDEAERRAAAPCDRAHQVVGRSAGRSDDEYFFRWRTLVEEPHGRTQPRRRGR